MSSSLDGIRLVYSKDPTETEVKACLLIPSRDSRVELAAKLLSATVLCVLTANR